ncbi:MAG: amino acid adenylation domain-containing protein [Arenicella sp.]
MSDNKFETIFPLAPAQLGIFYQAGLNESPGMHVEQSVVRVRGALDCKALAQAWEYVVQQRPVLRTAFVGRDLEKPLQVVFRHAASPMNVVDHLDESNVDIDLELETMAKHDREAGFDLRVAPLMRMTVVCINAQEYCLIWTHHHILMDGWCISLLMDDLWSSYDAYCEKKPPQLAARRLFSAYVQWVEQNNVEDVQRFWEQQLRGFTTTTRLGRPPSTGQTVVNDASYQQHDTRVDRLIYDRIIAHAREQKVTMATVVYAAWAKLLAAYSGCDDVVFGITASGRPSELQGVEDMIGLFTTTQPLRVIVPTQQSDNWLPQLQAQHQEQAQVGGYCSTGDIHNWSELPGREPLFDSVVVVENYPISAEALNRSGLQFSIDERPSVGARTGYAIALLVTPGAELDIQIVVDGSRFEPGSAKKITDHLVQILPLIVAPGNQGETPFTNMPVNQVPVCFPAQWQLALTEQQAPSTETEAILANIWAEVLGIASVGVTDDFFDLGGHSLIAAQIVNRVGQRFSRSVPLRMLFEHRTVSQLSQALLDTEVNTVKPVVLQSIAGNDDPVPASFNQERVWFIDQLGKGGSAAYCEQGAIRLSGQLVEEALAQALRLLCVRHESLRTSFVAGKEGLQQKVGDAPEQFMNRVDLCQWVDPTEQQQQLLSAIEHDRQIPFALATGPLWRATLFHLSNDEHVLLLSIHHIITDGWSHALLFRELGELYLAERDARPARLNTPTIRFADFAVWQRQLLSGPRLEQELTYWRQLLDSAPPVTTFPSDFQRPAVQQYRGAKVQHKLAASLSHDLQTYAREQGVSEFMVFVAAFSSLLYRYSGQTDLVIGTPVAGRPEPSLEDIVGFFVNTLVLRTDVSGKPSLNELVDRVKDIALDAFAHQDTPFDKIVEAVTTERSLNRNPLFQVFINMLNHPNVGLDLEGLHIEELEIPDSTSMFDLTLYIQPQEECLQLALLYDRDLFEPNRMQTALVHLEELLFQAIAEPDQPIDSIVLSGTQPSSSKSKLPQVKVAKTDCLDLDFDSNATELSAANLSRQASQLAHHIIECGGAAGEVVAIYAARNILLPIAIEGVLRSGCAFVVLDCHYPPEVLRNYLQRSEARFCLTLTDNASDIPCALKEAIEPLVHLSLSTTILEAKYKEQDLLTWFDSSHNESAYIAFTSGTTGVAKALLGRREPLRNFIQWYIATFDVSRDDRFSLLSGLGHDPVLRDILIAPVLGASIFVPPQEVFAEPKALLKYLADNQVSIIHITPALSRSLVSVSGTSSLPSLRYVFFAGELLDYADVNAVLRLAPNAICVNLYGATETPQAVTWHVVNPPSAHGNSATTLLESGPVPIGQSVSGWQVSIATEDGRPCGTYELGEITVNGSGLTCPLQLELDGNGFMTAHSDAASSVEPGTETMKLSGYRSGDLGFLRDDGTIQYTGRRDRQLNIRGYRIELADIEAVLSRFAEVNDAVVHTFGRGDDIEIVGYYTGKNVDSGALNTHIEAQLPVHSRPNCLVLLSTLPLTSNGKIAFSKLPRPIHEQSDAEETGQTHEKEQTLWKGQANELQTLVHKTLRSVLLSERAIGLDDDFFMHGGHSLRAARAIGQLSDALGVDVPLAALFENRTPRKLAAAIVNGNYAPSTQRITRDSDRSDTGPFIASDAQRRLWLLDKITDKAGVYNMTATIMLSGQLEPGALRTAFVDIVQRHESLRTRFVRIESELHQEILDVASFTLNELDLSHEVDAETNLETKAQQLGVAHGQARFDLEQEAPVRVTLVRLDESSHVLLLCVHHIVCDRWSMGVLQRDFSAAYRLAVHKSGHSSEALPIQYRDFAQWQHEQNQSEVMREHGEYWRTTLAGIQPLNMPTDFPRPAQRKGEGAEHIIKLGSHSKIIDQLAQTLEVTPFVVFTAVVKLLLFRYTNQQDLTVGTPTAGRTQSILEDQVGCFVSLLVLRSHLSPEQSFSDLVQQLAKTVASAYAHQAFSFDRLVETVGDVRDLSRSPLFDVAVVLQQQEEHPLMLPKVTTTIINEEPNTSKYDLSFVLVEQSEGYFLHIEYDTALFLPGRIERMSRHVCTLLERLAADTDVAVGHAQYLPKAEWNQVVETWNQTEAAYPDELTLVDLIAAQAHVRGDAVAIQYGDNTLSYIDLEDQSSQLAHALAQHGVSAGELVPVMQRPDHRAVISFLAIQKLGAAYVPIDSESPTSRIRGIIDQCSPAYLLVDDEHRSTLNDCLPQHSDMQVLDCGMRDTKVGSFASATQPDSVAYVIFTSGSTGVPKGCVVNQRNLVRLLANEHFPLDVGADDVWLCAHSMAFDFSVWEIYGALVTGGKAVIAPRQTVRNVSELRKLLVAQQISVLSQTPEAFLALAEIELKATEHTLDQHLRYVVFGGDRLAPNRLASWTQQYPLDRITLCNMYGITETTVHVTNRVITQADVNEVHSISPIGAPLPETKTYICDAFLQPVPIGVVGEILVGGTGVCQGYLNNQPLTNARFVDVSFAPTERVYRSGDLGCWREDGTLEYLGRNDDQIQLRGHRIELGEIEAALCSHPDIAAAVAIADNEQGASLIEAYWVAKDEVTPAEATIRAHLAVLLPAYMVPARLTLVPAIPMTANGKVDRLALRQSVTNQHQGISTGGKVHAVIADIWKSVLQRDHIAEDENFFDLGGHSLLLVDVSTRLQERLNKPVDIVNLFRYPTISALANFLDEGKTTHKVVETKPVNSNEAVAIIGLVGRFPGADSSDELWDNLCSGVESISSLSADELAKAGIPAELYQRDDYVMAKAVLQGADVFDSEFFDMSPREADITDPQQRVFLECAWQALEDAGYDPARYSDRIGVVAGCGASGYLLNNVYPNRSALEHMGDYPLLIGNDKDYLATRVSYKMNLRGPSLTIGTACSSSLVAVDWACEALRLGKAEMMLAGGVSIKTPLVEGYTYTQSGILSADGHCRPFAADAGGTVAGCGAGVVVLKTVSQAQADGDHIYAVIRGSATNNDGSGKVGYTAPSIDGQRAVISAALQQADTDPSTIAYVETHGTGTKLGDPIEVAALREAFDTNDKVDYRCSIGSIKSNIGHLGSAAGIAGLIKTTLAVEKAKIPPTLHAEKANPDIDFGGFNLCTRLSDWPSENQPRRAGVSSFGIGGTNAHVVLEQAPAIEHCEPQERPRIFPLSAKTPEALQARCEQLRYVLNNDDAPLLHDIAHTLQNGRAEFEFRQALVASQPDQLSKLLMPLNSQESSFEPVQTLPKVAFLIAGQGTQREGLVRSLYDNESVFRHTLDRCCDITQLQCEFDLRTVLFATAENAKMIDQTANAQPALFAFNYALAQLWASWGIKPQAMIGHSLGEYVAACVAGVFTLEDALQIVVQRGRIMQGLERGSMLAISISPEELAKRLPSGLDLAGVNGAQQCVVAGPVSAISDFHSHLASEGIQGQVLQTAHAFHSRSVDAVADELALAIDQFPRRAPKIPYISNVSGTWITADEAQDPEYYVRHMRQTVRFYDGINELTQSGTFQLLEIGPDETLSRLVRNGNKEMLILPSLRPHSGCDLQAVRETAALLWQCGHSLNWDAMGDTVGARRVSLPGYPFSRNRHWLQAGVDGHSVTSATPSDSSQRLPLDNWFYTPTVQRDTKFIPNDSQDKRHEPCLFIGDSVTLDDQLTAELAKTCSQLLRAYAADEYKDLGDNHFSVRTANTNDYAQLLAAVPSGPLHIVHTRTIDDDIPAFDDARVDCDGYDDLVSLLQAISRCEADTVRLTLITSGLIDVAGEACLNVNNARLAGLLRVAAQEIPVLSCRIIDVAHTQAKATSAQAATLSADILSSSSTSLLASRRTGRWVQGYEPISIPNSESQIINGPVLITGGLGGIGLLVAEHFAKQATDIVLVGRSPMPDRCDWNQWLQSEGESTLMRELLTQGLEPLPNWSEHLHLCEERLYEALNIPQMDLQLEQRLNALCSQHILEYFQSSGVTVENGRHMTMNDLRTQLKIQPAYERFFQFFIRTLAADQVLKIEADSLTFAKLETTSPSEILERDLLTEYPDIASQLKMLRQCAEGFGTALSGAVEGVSVLYPEGKSDDVRESSAEAEDADATRLYIRLLIDAIEHVIDRADGRLVRILEVGAGNGFATEMLAPRLCGKNVEYVVTDLGRSFVLAHERRAVEQRFDFISTAPFDISQPASEQGFDAHEFDVIFGLNVVHVSPNIETTLRNLQDLMVPGGVLGMVETVRSHRWTEMVWGLADGWWSFEDTHLREHSPIMAIEAWEQVCSSAGFEWSCSFPAAGPSRKLAESALILAQAPLSELAAFDAKHTDTAAGIRDKIKAVQRIEENGSTVMIACADASSAEQMENVVTQAEKKYGPIGGVVHAAGDTRQGKLSRPLGEVDSLASQRLFRSRVTPALVLDSLLDPESVEFAVAISSNAAILGGLGLSMYSAACNALDAFAQGNPRLPWVSTNWDRWPTIRALAQANINKISIDRYAMDKDEAFEAFQRIVNSRITGQVIISAGSLQARIDSWVDVGVESKPPLLSALTSLHQRPRLDVEFEAPNNETEKSIAGLWRELVGIEDIGIHDNFFDLGGDSMIGTQFTARFAKKHSIPLPIQSLFEYPTIAGLAGLANEILISRNALQAVVDKPLAQGEEEGEI